MAIVGDRDLEQQTVSVRHRSGKDLGAMSLDAFTALLQEERDTKAIR
jgi:threonyl-tRNA synthetase